MLKKVILGLGCLIVAVAAGWASFSTLAFLAEATDWPGGYWLLPTSIDVLGAVGCYAWLTSSFPAAARRFARWTTFAAIAASVVGNAVGHLVAARAVPVSVALIVLVGAVPPSSLAAIIHLIVQCFSSPVAPAKSAPVKVRAAAPAPDLKPSPSPAPSGTATPKKQGAAKPKPPAVAPVVPKVDDVELQRARHADRDHRAANDGQPITRDGLKAALGCGTTKATALLAALKREAA